jgi:hypothetical protein
VRTAPAVQPKTSYEEEKAQVLRELRALKLTFPEKRIATRSFIEKAIKFIEKE